MLHRVNGWKEEELLLGFGQDLHQDLHVVFRQLHLHWVHDMGDLLLDRASFGQGCMLPDLGLELVLGDEGDEVVCEARKLEGR